MAIALVAVCIDSLDVLEVGLALDALHAGSTSLPRGLIDPPRHDRITRSLADADWREDARALLEEPAVIDAAQAFVDGCHRVVGSRAPDSMLDPSWLEAVQDAYARSEELCELGEALLDAIDLGDDEELDEEPAIAPSTPAPAPQAPPAPTWERPIVSTALSIVAICMDSFDLVETGITLDVLHAGLTSLPSGMLVGAPETRERIERSLADAEWREDARALLDDPETVGVARAFVDCCFRLVGSRPADPLSDAAWLQAVRGAYSGNGMLRELAEAVLYVLDPAGEDAEVEELGGDEELEPPVANASTFAEPTANAASGDVAIAAQVIVRLTDVTHVERYGLTLGALESGQIFEKHPAVADAARVFLRACVAVAPPKGALAEAMRDSTWWQFLRWGFETGAALKALADAFLRAAAAAYSTIVPWAIVPDLAATSPAPERTLPSLQRTAPRVSFAAAPWRTARMTSRGQSSRAHGEAAAVARACHPSPDCFPMLPRCAAPRQGYTRSRWSPITEIGPPLIE